MERVLGDSIVGSSGLYMRKKLHCLGSGLANLELRAKKLEPIIANSLQGEGNSARSPS